MKSNPHPPDPVPPKKDAGQAVAVSKPIDQDSVSMIESLPGHSIAQDTVQSRDIQIRKGGESSPVELPLTDSLPRGPLPAMPPQGPPDSLALELDAHRLEHAAPDTLILAEILTPDPPRLQTYTPSSMLAKGQWEARYFQQIYSQTHFFDAQGNAQPQNNRSTYYSGISSLTLGWKSWINFGVEAWLRSVRIDQVSSSPFAILGFQAGPNSRTSLTTIGPKVKVQPFGKVNGFTIQSALLFPVAKDLEGRLSGRPYLASQNLQSWTQFYYTLSLHPKWQLFTQLDVFAAINTRAASQGQPTTIALPLSAYLSYFPTRRITVYAMNQAWPTTSSIWYQAGLGGKYRFADGFDLELMYGRFLAGINAAGQANAFNLGLRFVKW